jgi:SAM-dependent methyltransferase
MLNHLVRYEPVVELVRLSAAQTVLEVGAGDEGLARWLGGERSVTAVDAVFSRLPAAGERVVADARRLPFGDAQFDVVVALDLLEHIRAEDRGKVVSELARTARRLLVVGCPTGAAALELDRRLARMLDRRGETYAGSWLEDHLANGFPEAAELKAALKPYGQVRLIPNEALRAHELLMRAEVTRGPRKLTDALERLLLPVLAGDRGWRAFLVRAIRGFDRGQPYRTIAVVERR